ncbi:hypothetical protein LCGC14_1487350, partial [marine sediment metagenome]
MNRLLLAIALLGSSPAFAQETQPFTIDLKDFCGIDDSLVSTKISPCHAQDASNVLTDNGRLEQIPGIKKIIDSILDGFPGKGAWPFTDSGGTEYLILHASATIYQTNFSGDRVFLNNVDDTVAMEVVQAFNRIYFNNGTDTPWSWDGTSTAAVSAMPLCNQMEFAHERIYCSNTSTSNSEVAVSSFGGAEYWTVPADLVNEPDAPNSFNFNKNDGDNINCLKVTPYGIFIGKGNTTHILKGFDNETYYKRIIAPDVGCVDDRLVQMLEGNVIWLAKQGVYAWPGAGPPILISKKIENRINNIRQLTAQSDSYNVNTQLDWEVGSSNVSPVVGTWSTKISPGLITPSSWSLNGPGLDGGWVMVDVDTTVLSSAFLDNFDDIVTLKTEGETIASNFNWVVARGSWSIESDRTLTTQGAGPNDNGNRSMISTDIVQSSGIWTFVVKSSQTPSAAFRWYIVSNTTGVHIGPVYPDVHYIYLEEVGGNMNLVTNNGGVLDTAPTPKSIRDGNNHLWTVTRDTAGFMVALLDGDSVLSGTHQYSKITNLKTMFAVDGDGGYTPGQTHMDAAFFPNFFETQASTIYDTGFSTPTYGHFTFTGSSLTTSSVTFHAQTSNTNDGSGFTDFESGTLIDDLTTIGGNRYFRQRIIPSPPFATPISSITASDLAVISTGIYSSKVQFIGEDISIFGVGDFTTTESPAGRLFFETRAATFTFTAGNTDISWTSHANHTTVQHSTGAYFQFRVISSSVTSSTEVAQVHRFILNWAEGTSAKGASLVLDRRYIMCVTISSSSTINDSCEILQTNNEWTRLEGISVSALTTFDNDPIGVDGSTNSAVWKIMQE